MGYKVSKCHAPKNCAKNNMYVALVKIIRQARQNILGQNCWIFKNTKILRKWMASHHSSSDDAQLKRKHHRINLQLIRFWYMWSIFIDKKIGEATAIQKYWVKWTVGYWGPVATSIRPVYFYLMDKGPYKINHKCDKWELIFKDIMVIYTSTVSKS